MKNFGAKLTDRIDMYNKFSFFNAPIKPYTDEPFMFQLLLFD